MEFNRSRAFDAADQRRFAQLSGDRNPIHLDPLAARRTQPGTPVAHGMHVVLWVVDELHAQARITRRIATLDVQFKRYVYAGAVVSAAVVRDTEATLDVHVIAGGLPAVTIKIGFAERVVPAPAPDAEPAAGPPEPNVLDLKQIAHRSGRLRALDPEPFARAFPAASAALGARTVAGLAQLSALVGMVCPGLHSIFDGVALAFAPASSSGAGTGTAFRVGLVDERFRLVRMDVAGDGLAGAVRAFVRQPPVSQRSLADVRAVVEPGEFAGATALIVGGSRGLGSLTARLIAAGGGRVVVTYRVGAAEAEALAAELGAAACAVVRYDAHLAAEPQLPDAAAGCNELYYFATTQIARQQAEAYAPARFADYARVYVDGFAQACVALRERTAAPVLAAFYPSSVAVERRPKDMTEYSMAKAAGEILGAELDRSLRGVRVLVERLPRILTDQTATVVPVEASDALAVMLPIVRRMRRLRAAGDAASS